MIDGAASGLEVVVHRDVPRRRYAHTSADMTAATKRRAQASGRQQCRAQRMTRGATRLAARTTRSLGAHAYGNHVNGSFKSFDDTSYSSSAAYFEIVVGDGNSFGKAAVSNRVTTIASQSSVAQPRAFRLVVPRPRIQRIPAAGGGQRW